jgi:hypothetical protein
MISKQSNYEWKQETFDCFRNFKCSVCNQDAVLFYETFGEPPIWISRCETHGMHGYDLQGQRHLKELTYDEAICALVFLE